MEHKNRQILEALIKRYFQEGRKYKIIISLLEKRHNIRVSTRTLERVLQDAGLKRKKAGITTATPECTRAIQHIQEESCNRVGYRRTWRLLRRKYGILATQDNVRKFLLAIDPSAVTSRIGNLLTRRSYTSAGANHVWHFDGYDKLKPYGFAIHGCTDGFSRKLLWLNCSITNSNPRVILYHYLQSVLREGGCPYLLRSNCGTVTGMAAAAQCAFRGGPQFHVFVPSYRNQRIESWWSVLRRQWTQCWMDLFDDLVGFGAFVPCDEISCAIAQFCFMVLIQNELDDFVNDWNSHYIRRTKTSGCPGGIPEELFEFPEQEGFRNPLVPVAVGDVQCLLSEAEDPRVCSNEEVKRKCFALMISNGWHAPHTKKEAVNPFLCFASSYNQFT